MTTRQKYQKAWFENHREKQRSWSHANYRRRKDFVNQFKSRPCQDCGRTYPLCCMDFDHVRGEKLFNIGGGKMGMPSLEKLAAEIAKCDVVCSNCHRIRTEARGYTNARRVPSSGD